MDRGSRGKRERLSYANVMATVAVFLALGGGAYAALGKNSVGSKQVKPNSLKANDLAVNAVTASEAATNSIGSGELANDAVGTAEVANGVPAVGVNSGGNFVLAVASSVTMPFVNEDYDTAGIHDGSPNTDLVAPVDGVYLVSGVTEFASGAGTGFFSLNLAINGEFAYSPTFNLPHDELQPFSTTLLLEAGDVVTQVLGNDADVQVGVNTKLTMVWIAPGPA